MSAFEDFTDQLRQAEDRVRRFKFEENEYILRALDPYGHWHISRRGEDTPEVLSGAYTSFIVAEEAIVKWENSQRKDVKDGKEVGAKDRKGVRQGADN